CDILLHFDKKPFCQAADFCALERIFCQQTTIAFENAMCLVQKFHQHIGSAERPHAVIYIDRESTCGIECKELPALFPWLFFSKFRRKAIFRENKTDES